MHEINNTMHSSLINEFDRVLTGGTYIRGNECNLFEKTFAKYCGSTECVGVGNGYDALCACLWSIGLEPGDEVIVPSNTFIATWLTFPPKLVPRLLLKLC